MSGGRSTLADARKVLEGGDVRFLTLDFMLPDGNGLDFLRELRATRVGADLPVLLISPLAGAAQDLEHVVGSSAQAEGAEHLVGLSAEARVLLHLRT